MPVRIILADDHAIVREGLRTLLEQKGFEVVGEAADGQAAIRLCRELRPGVAVLDLTMPLINGVDATREIVRDCPSTRVVMLTMHSEEHYVLEAFRAGVSGYVVKTQAASDLARALYVVLRGSTYRSSKASRPMVAGDLDKHESSEDCLTPREREVLQLIAEGKSTKQIADLLRISNKTAETHRTRIMNKLDTQKTAGRIHRAFQRGLVQP